MSDTDSDDFSDFLPDDKSSPPSDRHPSAHPRPNSKSQKEDSSDSSNSATPDLADFKEAPTIRVNSYFQNVLIKLVILATSERRPIPRPVISKAPRLWPMGLSCRRRQAKETERSQ